MLRCPFNNFSKCDGSCPFSTDNFNECRIAGLLIALEGQSRGQLAQIATANAHMVELKAMVEGLAERVDGIELADHDDLAPVPEVPRRPMGLIEWIESRGKAVFVGMTTTDAYRTYLVEVSAGHVETAAGNPCTRRAFTNRVMSTLGLLCNASGAETAYYDPLAVTP